MKKEYIDCNTTTIYPTYLLAPVELIKQARNEFNIASENWPYPTKYRSGVPNDCYYSEVWVDGMDWQHTYWIIESILYSNPAVQPLMIFDDHDEQDKFNVYDFSEFMMAVLWYRRDCLWIKSGDLGRFNDTIWPFVKRCIPGEVSKKPPYYSKYYMEHASQPRVEFWLNKNFMRKL